jgi:hypothetical protein
VDLAEESVIAAEVFTAVAEVLFGANGVRRVFRKGPAGAAASSGPEMPY